MNSEMHRAASLRNLQLADAANRLRWQFGVWRCAACKTEAKATVHQLRKTYCSKTCMAEGYRHRMRGEENPNFKNAGWRICEQCEERFPHYNKKRRFCSLACRDASSFYMRGKCRKDNNHQGIIETIRRVGGSVIDISAQGSGVPDLIVDTRQGIQLAEIKNPQTDYGKKGLSKKQRAWAILWRGPPVYVIRTDADAINLVMGNFQALEGIGGFHAHLTVVNGKRI